MYVLSKRLVIGVITLVLISDQSVLAEDESLSWWPFRKRSEAAESDTKAAEANEMHQVESIRSIQTKPSLSKGTGFHAVSELEPLPDWSESSSEGTNSAMILGGLLWPDEARPAKSVSKETPEIEESEEVIEVAKNQPDYSVGEVIDSENQGTDLSAVLVMAENKMDSVVKEQVKTPITMDKPSVGLAEPSRAKNSVVIREASPTDWSSLDRVSLTPGGPQPLLGLAALMLAGLILWRFLKKASKPMLLPPVEVRRRLGAPYGSSVSQLTFNAPIQR